MKRGRDQVHAPTTEELNAAISSILRNNESSSVKEICDLITKNHKGWTLPERRVAKFVKRQKQESKAQTDDDASRVSTPSLLRARGVLGSAVKGTSRSLRKVLYMGTKKKDHDDGTEHSESTSSPPVEVVSSQNLLPPLSFDDTEPARMLDFATPEKTETRPLDAEAAPDSAVDVPLPTVYHDDNKGKKDSGFCQPCEGCTVL